MSSINNGQHPPRIVIIGGGATGTGIAKAAAEHGMAVTLVERGDIGQGTSSHFHGILHSGGRYAVNDPVVAAECYAENQRLRQLIPSAIADTGGLFVALNNQEMDHAAKLVQACQTAAIPVKQLSVAQALQTEPHLNRNLKLAFTVPDAYVDGTELMRLNRDAALHAEHPARFLTDHAVIGIKKQGQGVTAVTVRDNVGKREDIACDYVINAAGVWAGRIAQLADIRLEMVFDKGTMIVFQKQFSTAVLNRCRPEADGDLLVPHQGQSIMGTTARVISDPDDCLPTQEEADVLVREGAELVPELAQAEAVRVYAGVRPLLKTGDLGAGTSRSISRSYRVIDHADEGVANLISVVGGKVTLYRLMAESTMNLLRQKLDDKPVGIVGKDTVDF